MSWRHKGEYIAPLTLNLRSGEVSGQLFGEEENLASENYKFLVRPTSNKSYHNKNAITAHNLYTRPQKCPVFFNFKCFITGLHVR